MISGYDDAEAIWMNGQRIAYVYKAQKAIDGSKVRIIWGKVTRAHGKPEA